MHPHISCRSSSVPFCYPQPTSLVGFFMLTNQCSSDHSDTWPQYIRLVSTQEHRIIITYSLRRKPHVSQRNQQLRRTRYYRHLWLIRRIHPASSHQHHAGRLKVGDNLSVASGVLSVPQAAYQSYGVVSQAAPVADVETIAVTDIESAQSAIAAMGTTLAELMQALRNSGALGVQD